MVATELKDEEAGKVTFLFCLNLKFDDVPAIPPNVTCSWSGTATTWLQQRYDVTNVCYKTI